MSKTEKIRRLFFILFTVSFHYTFPQNQSAVIIQIIDGDSYIASTGTGNLEIRLEGIDCPELDQPYGLEAKLEVEDLLDQTVTITKKGKDRFGRTLVDLYFNGTWINYLLIKNGYAWHFKKYSNDPILAQAEVDARKSELGLWALNNPIAPWDWRAGSKSSTTYIPSQGVQYNQNSTLQNLSQPQRSGQTVVICEGSSSVRYHKSSSCFGLRNCRGGISKITLEEAQRIGRTPCHICY